MSYSNIEQIISFFSNDVHHLKNFQSFIIKLNYQVGIISWIDYQAMSENDIPLSTWKAAEIAVEKLDHMDVICECLCAKLTLLSEC